jgi:hypothetical protein
MDGVNNDNNTYIHAGEKKKKKGYICARGELYGHMFFFKYVYIFYLQYTHTLLMSGFGKKNSNNSSVDSWR